MERTIMKTGLWAKCTDPDDICSVLEQIPVCAGGTNFDAVAFLHGVCGIFALALHDRFDHKLDWVLDDEYDGAFKNNPWAHLVHVFCSITDGEDILATVDVRGISDDFELFLDEFADFVDYPGVWVSPPSREELEREMIREVGAETYKEYYQAAMTIIEEHPDWYSAGEDDL